MCKSTWVIWEVGNPTWDCESLAQDVYLPINTFCQGQHFASNEGNQPTLNHFKEHNKLLCQTSNDTVEFSNLEIHIPVRNLATHDFQNFSINIVLLLFTNVIQQL